MKVPERFLFFCHLSFGQKWHWAIICLIMPVRRLAREVSGRPFFWAQNYIWSQEWTDKILEVEGQDHGGHAR